MSSNIPDRFVPSALLADVGSTGADDEILEPLELVCRALDTEAQLTGPGREATHRYLHRLLTVRSQLAGAFDADPAMAAERIDAPIFVIGAPRTGTTVMHRLLASLPSLRAPEGWEFLWPVGPADGTDDRRVELAADELTFPQRVASGLTAIHTYSARMPKECLSAMAFSFRTEEFISRYDVPSYVAWLQRADMTPAYEMHRQVLQVLQAGMSGVRWVLKSPVHLQAIPELVATYPDARFVVTHRDPDDVLASVSSLIATLRSAFSDAVDPAGIGRYHLDLYGRSLSSLVDHVDRGVLPADRTVHVWHRDIVRDAPAEVGRVCAALGIDHDPSTVDAAHGAERSDALGAHTYDAAMFGLDATDHNEAARAGLDRYRERFDLR